MKAKAALSTGAILIMAVAACGGNGDSGDTEASDGEEGVQIAPELHIADGAQPPTLDPVSTTAATRGIALFLYEPLLALDADGEPQPVLAESYDVSEDGLTYTFTLRDVEFHDGSPLTGDDVVASLQRWQEMTTVGSAYFSEAEFESSEEGVVTMTLPAPMYLAPTLLSDPMQMPYIMPASIAEEADAGSLDEYIGTGPYKFVDWATDQYVSLERNEEYASPEGEVSGMAGENFAHYEEVYVHFVSDESTRLTGLQTGEYDVALNLPHDNFDQLDDDPNLNTVIGDTGFNIAVFNKEEGMMTDVNMREAVLAAMDTEAAMQAAFGDEEFYNNNSAVMTEESPWHVEPTPDFEDLHQNAHPDIAEDLLTEAGYDGDPIRILSTRDYPEHYDLSVMLQQQLEDAGMTTDLIINDWPTVTELREDPSQYEITMTAITMWPSVPATLLYYDPAWFGWTDSDEIAAAADAMISAEDEAGAHAAMVDLQEATNAYLPVAKFGDATSVYGHSVDVEGFEYVTGLGPLTHRIRPSD